MDNELETWKFGIDNNKLVELVLLGKKTATTSLYEEDDIPVIGEESIITYDNGKYACVVKTRKVIITEFKNIKEDLSNLEGEGDFESWKKNHIKFFKNINPNFNEDTKVIFEIFEVIKKFN